MRQHAPRVKLSRVRKTRKASILFNFLSLNKICLRLQFPPLRLQFPPLRLPRHRSLQQSWQRLQRRQRPRQRPRCRRRRRRRASDGRPAHRVHRVHPAPRRPVPRPRNRQRRCHEGIVCAAWQTKRGFGVDLKPKPKQRKERMKEEW